MRTPPLPVAVASAVLAAFGVTLVWVGLDRPGPPEAAAVNGWGQVAVGDAPAEGDPGLPGSSPLDPSPLDPSPLDPSPLDPSPLDPSPLDPSPLDPSPPASDAVPAPVAGTPTASPDPSATQGPVAPPVGLDIPRIGVHTDVSPVGRDASGAIAVPAPGGEGGSRAFWYTGLVAPGAVGPAVVVGHVDSRTGGPAVFYRLGELAVGDSVTVRRADGTSVRFLVQGIGRYAKADFPSRQVYGPTSGPTLRLITCGGAFDRSRGSYVDNVVVYATQV